MRLRPLLLYPLLAAVYPVFALAAQNFREGLQPADVMGPLVFSVALALAIWVLSRLLSADVHVRGVVTFSLVVVFVGYRALVGLVSQLPSLSPFHVHLGSLALGLMLVVGGIVWARRTVRDLAVLTRYLNATLLVLLCFPVASLGWNTAMRSMAPDFRSSGEETFVPAGDSTRLPGHGRVHVVRSPPRFIRL